MATTTTTVITLRSVVLYVLQSDERLSAPVASMAQLAFLSPKLDAYKLQCNLDELWRVLSYPVHFTRACPLYDHALAVFRVLRRAVRLSPGAVARHPFHRTTFVLFEASDAHTPGIHPFLGHHGPYPRTQLLRLNPEAYKTELLEEITLGEKLLFFVSVLFPDGVFRSLDAHLPEANKPETRSITPELQRFLTLFTCTSAAHEYRPSSRWKSFAVVEFAKLTAHARIFDPFVNTLQIAYHWIKVRAPSVAARGAAAAPAGAAAESFSYTRSLLGGGGGAGAAAAPAPAPSAALSSDAVFLFFAWIPWFAAVMVGFNNDGDRLALMRRGVVALVGLFNDLPSLAETRVPRLYMVPASVGPFLLGEADEFTLDDVGARDATGTNVAMTEWLRFMMDLCNVVFRYLTKQFATPVEIRDAFKAEVWGRHTRERPVEEAVLWTSLKWLTAIDMDSAATFGEQMNAAAEGESDGAQVRKRATLVRARLVSHLTASATLFANANIPDTVLRRRVEAMLRPSGQQKLLVVENMTDLEWMDVLAPVRGLMDAVLGQERVTVTKRQPFSACVLFDASMYGGCGAFSTLVGGDLFALYVAQVLLSFEMLGSRDRLCGAQIYTPGDVRTHRRVAFPSDLCRAMPGVDVLHAAVSTRGAFFPAGPSTRLRTAVCFASLLLPDTMGAWGAPAAAAAASGAGGAAAPASSAPNWMKDPAPVLEHHGNWFKARPGVTPIDYIRVAALLQMGYAPDDVRAALYSPAADASEGPAMIRAVAGRLVPLLWLTRAANAENVDGVNGFPKQTGSFKNLPIIAVGMAWSILLMGAAVCPRSDGRVIRHYIHVSMMKHFREPQKDEFPRLRLANGPAAVPAKFTVPSYLRFGQVHFPQYDVAAGRYVARAPAEFVELTQDDLAAFARWVYRTYDQEKPDATFEQSKARRLWKEGSTDKLWWILSCISVQVPIPQVEFEALYGKYEACTYSDGVLELLGTVHVEQGAATRAFTLPHDLAFDALGASASLNAVTHAAFLLALTNTTPHVYRMPDVDWVEFVRAGPPLAKQADHYRVLGWLAKCILDRNVGAFHGLVAPTLAPFRDWLVHAPYNGGSPFHPLFRTVLREVTTTGWTVTPGMTTFVSALTRQVQPGGASVEPRTPASAPRTGSSFDTPSGRQKRRLAELSLTSPSSTQRRLHNSRSASEPPAISPPASPPAVPAYARAAEESDPGEMAVEKPLLATQCDSGDMSLCTHGRERCANCDYELNCYEFDSTKCRKCYRHPGFLGD